MLITILVFCSLLFLVAIAYKLVPLIWYRYTFFQQHYAKSKTNKHLPVLPFNFGLGQQLDFLDPTQVFAYFIKYAQTAFEAKDSDGMQIINICLCPVFFISSPKHVKEVCVTNYTKYNKGWIYSYFKKLLRNGLVVSEGNTWKSHRSMMNPIFGPQNVAELIQLMQQKTRDKVQQWKLENVNKPIVLASVSEEMSTLTFAVIMDVVFGMDHEPEVYKMIGSLWDPILQDFFIHFAIAGLTSEYISSFLPWGKRMDAVCR